MGFIRGCHDAFKLPIDHSFMFLSLSNAEPAVLGRIKMRRLRDGYLGRGRKSRFRLFHYLKTFKVSFRSALICFMKCYAGFLP